jgi:predicted glycoside hydrolase/deacetylase ChbG (UPF0249 family)
MDRTGPALIARCLVRPWLIGAVLAEFEAQIRWARQHGVRPTHLDSHRHVHAFPPLFAGTVGLARRYGIAFVRWPCERLPAGDWPAPPDGQIRTARLLRALCAVNGAAVARPRATGGTWGIAHTGQIDAGWLLVAAAKLPRGTTEIMTHPGLPHDLDDRQTRLRQSRQAELEALCERRVAEAFRRNRLELVHYGHLRP